MLYIINSDSTDSKYHETHHYDCGHRPSPQNQEELGNYYYDSVAMIFAKDRYDDADGCYYCMPTEHHG
jgi:hypothetical protein